MVRKERRSFDVVIWDERDVDMTLKDFIDDLTALYEAIPEEFRDSARINIEYEGDYYGGGYVNSRAWYVKPETDEEMDERVAKEILFENQQSHQTELRERQFLEMLKKKYE